MNYYHWLGREAEAINAWLSQAIAYGYEEPQAGTEALDLTDSNSKGGVREPLAVEADGFITVYPKLNRSLGTKHGRPIA